MCRTTLGYERQGLSKDGLQGAEELAKLAPGSADVVLDESLGGGEADVLE